MGRWLTVLVSLVGGALILSAQSSPRSAPAHLFDVDRSALPPALQNIPLQHLSSGALLRLDRGGNLVKPPSVSPEQRAALKAAAQAQASLDPRVETNTRLGNDPSGLPANMRAQAEPHIARSPLNTSVLAATFQEGRFTDGGAVDCGYSVSTDGGFSWTRSLIPHLTQTNGGQYFRATDPIAGIDLHGNIFLTTEAATDANFNGGIILVSRSSDGGATFGNPAVVYQPKSNTLFPDKPWMAINNFMGTPTAGRILVTFTLFGNVNNDGGAIERAYSDDGGITWSSVASINSGVNNAQSSEPMFLPNGNVVIVYWNFGTRSNPTERLEAVISTDGGQTYGTPKTIRPVIEYNEPSIRSGAFISSAVCDRTHGNIFLVYQTLLNNSPRIVFTKSTNGGTTWSNPVAVSDNPPGLGVFNPAVNVSNDGQVVSVVFYDHRDNPGSETVVDLYLAQSLDGGATWQPNVRVSSVSTDATLAPLTSEGYMLGDYQGVAEASNANVPSVPVWIDTRTGNPDPFVARVWPVTAPPPTTPTPTPSPGTTPTPTATPTPTTTPTPTATPNQSVATPVISPNGGTFKRKVSVSLSCATSGATIFYTTNGTDPTQSSQAYSSAIQLKSSVTLKVRAFKTGFTASNVAAATFKITKRRISFD